MPTSLLPAELLSKINLGLRVSRLSSSAFPAGANDPNPEVLRQVALKMCVCWQQCRRTGCGFILWPGIMQSKDNGSVLRAHHWRQESLKKIPLGLFILALKLETEVGGGGDVFAITKTRHGCLELLLAGPVTSICPVEIFVTSHLCISPHTS